MKTKKSRGKIVNVWNNGVAEYMAAHTLVNTAKHVEDLCAHMAQFKKSQSDINNVFLSLLYCANYSDKDVLRFVSLYRPKIQRSAVSGLMDKPEKFVRQLFSECSVNWDMLIRSAMNKGASNLVQVILSMHSFSKKQRLDLSLYCLSQNREDYFLLFWDKKPRRLIMRHVVHTSCALSHVFGQKPMPNDFMTDIMLAPLKEKGDLIEKCEKSWGWMPKNIQNRLTKMPFFRKHPFAVRHRLHQQVQHEWNVRKREHRKGLTKL